MHDGDVREALGQEIAGYSIFMFPFLYGLAFTFRWFVSNLGLGTGSGTSEVAPSTGDSHCFLEACLEDGPVGAIGVKLGDVGRELFDDGSGRHGGCSGEF